MDVVIAILFYLAAAMCAWRSMTATGSDLLGLVLLTVACLMIASTARAARRARP